MNKDEFLILESGVNQAKAITIIRKLELFDIPYKETNDGIIVLMSKKLFDKKYKQKLKEIKK